MSYNVFLSRGLKTRPRSAHAHVSPILMEPGLIPTARENKMDQRTPWHAIPSQPFWKESHPMNSRVGFTTGAITLAMVLGLIVFWTINDSVRADSKEGDLATKSSAEKHQESREQPIDTEWQPGDSIRASKTERKILQELNTSTKTDYSDVSLREVLANIARQHYINVVFAEAAVADAGLSFDHEVAISLKERFGKEVTLEEALGAILPPAGLVYIVEDDVLKVTVEKSLATNIVTRAYSIPYIPDLAGRERLANHLTLLIRAKQQHRFKRTQNHNEQESEDDATQPGFDIQFPPTPTITVFQDRVVVIASVTEQNDLQELLRLIYIKP